ncbi:hypothetical protein UFOVP273_17 [uncultured Caudovirales phage]|uniref:Uncharacterized protein n=1 Tax=uncultured Caudovirales phage TaxID=2100421 RepID=A0A6J5LIY0_9CAUD|nr:hypothetical protein UFOVP273_17 [uncultured Caudovirales phage]
MVDSRDKGARAETTVRDELRKVTGHQWERVPGSGALNEKHGLKGDLYIPNEKNNYCVEVKHYSECQIDHTLISGKNPQLLEWWEQTTRQGQQVSREPLLIFKHDRSKLYCAFYEVPSVNYPHIFISKNGHEFFIALLEDWLKHEKPKFIN